VSLSQQSHPDELVIEASSICNMNCLHRFRRAMSDLVPRHIDLTLLKTLLIEVFEISVKKIVFSGWVNPYYILI
jgi:hypothetical protein